jgi:chitodextrinase
LSGSGGVPGDLYYLLLSSNAALTPRSFWTRISTNVFAADGHFTNTVALNQLFSKAFLQAAQSLTRTSLVAAYSFDEGAGSIVNDASGKGNTGTLANAAWTSGGKYGGALVFNGTSTLVNVPDSPSLHLTRGMTLEAWLNPSSANNVFEDVIYKATDNYFLEASSPNNGVPVFGGTFSPSLLYGTAALTANTWTHLAATYDGATMRLYVNGLQVASRARTATIATSTNPLQIGGDSLYGQFFQGTIDEVRVYNAALTPAQIQADMNTPLAGAPTAPGDLTVTRASSNQISLSWTASSDSVGVTAYLVEQCRGEGCGGFAQVGTSTGTSYTDSGLAANTTYNYRVRAVDSTGTLGPYSQVIQAYTGLSVSPRVAALTFTRTQQFTAVGGSVNWSVDGLAGGSAASGTITAAGLYSTPTNEGTHTVTATTLDQSSSGSATVYVTGYRGTFTHHNDNLRTGQNLSETVLTPQNVSSTTFGKLFSYPIDGLAFASALYVANVNVPGQGYHNLAFVVTEHDSAYAFDADGLTNAPVWHVSFINPAAGVTTVPAADTGETGDIPNEIGITSTPVIDPASGTLYLVAKTREVSGGNTSYVQRLHALDIATGTEKFGGPVVITATVPGSGVGSQGGHITFDPLLQNQRSALLLLNGVVYFGFGTHGNPSVYHGWVLGYNATTLQRVMAFNTTPNAAKGGVWHGGGGVAADASADLYFATGNGTFDGNTNGTDYGDSVLKITTGGSVVDYFTPHDQLTLDTQDIDLGSGGVLLLPDQPGTNQHLLISCGKGGTLYLINRDNLGHFKANADTQIVQVFPDIFPGGTLDIGNRINPVYFNGNVYFSVDADNLKMFQLTNGLLSNGPTSQSVDVYQYPGGPLAISANGAANGILWVVQRFGVDANGNGVIAPGVLRAYDPANLGTILYDSNQAGSRDTMDYAAKFSVPCVANGKVFVASQSHLTAYGLLP